MKKYSIVVLSMTVSLYAGNVGQSDKKLMQTLLKEVQNLKKEVQVLKQGKKENTQAIEEVNNYTENIEAKSFKDKIDFGLGYRTNLDNLYKKYADNSSVSDTNVWSTKLMLNMKANISSNMNFYGRLSMYKYWGSSYIHPYTYYDNMQGRVPSNSGIYAERAYINWFLFQKTILPISLTIGRQPTSDGPSKQFKNNTVRKGTYTALIFDGATDGVVLTANLSKILSPKTYLRLGYAKGYGYTQTDETVGNAFIGASNNDIKDTNVFGIFFDTTVPNIEKSLIQLTYSKMVDVVANPLDINVSENKNIGNVDFYGAMVECTNLKDLNLDLFAQYGHSVAYPNGNEYLLYGGLLSANGDISTKQGDAIWIGGRYGFGENEKYKFGLEYNYGSKNWINLTQGSEDLYNKLATRGNAYETYLMYVINRYSNIRLGYIQINYKYTGSGWFVGESRKITSSMDYADSTLKELESIYLKMNVNF